MEPCPPRGPTISGHYILYKRLREPGCPTPTRSVQRSAATSNRPLPHGPASGRPQSRRSSIGSRAAYRGSWKIGTVRFSTRHNENIEVWGSRPSMDLLDELCLDSGGAQNLLIHDTVVVQRIALLDLDERRRETGMRGRHERVCAHVSWRRAVHIYRRAKSSVSDSGCRRIYQRSTYLARADRVRC